MTSIIKVKDIYNKVALITGFPQYSNDTDTPDINRFILEMINEGLQSVIDVLNTNSTALQIGNRIVTTEGKWMYAFDGIIRHIEIENLKGQKRRINYKNNIDFLMTPDKFSPTGFPTHYTVSGGYLKLYPIPDNSYNITMVLSTNNLVASDNDELRSTVEHINDSILCTQDVANLITLRTCALIFIRCNSNLANLYSEMSNSRIKTYIEKDYGSNEAQRGYSNKGGHYDPERGLLG